MRKYRIMQWAMGNVGRRAVVATGYASKETWDSCGFGHPHVRRSAVDLRGGVCEGLRAAPAAVVLDFLDLPGLACPEPLPRHA